MRVVLGVAGIRMRMDDLDAVDLVRMVKERRSAVIPCKERDERQSDYFARPVFHSVANLVKSMEFFTLGGSVRFLLRFVPERRLIGHSEKVYVRRKESVSEDK